MESRKLLIRMLRQLLEDMHSLQQQGAGYFTCIPMSRRYNKLLARARELAKDVDGMMDTFEEIPETDPKDPGEKYKMVQGIRIEVGQLISLLESLETGDATAKQTGSAPAEET